MNIDAFGRKLFEPDYQSASTPSSVKTWRPLIYQEGTIYRCQHTDYPLPGIFGCGETPQLAMEDWDRDFKRVMEMNTEITSGHA